MAPRPDPGQVRELFDRVVDLPPDERRRHLDEHCPDPQLRQRVERLLAADTEANSLPLTGPPFPALAFPPSEGPRGPGEGASFPALTGYEILRELGHGGMGVVYQAFDRRHGRAVALKVMQGLSPSLQYRFKQEFRSLVGLHHPNLVTLYDLVAEGGQWFFTMELVEGVDFLTYVGSGPWSPVTTNRFCDALRQLVEGVAFLHAARKLHRDVKPSNVLVTPQGRVKLLDFGLVAELGPDDLHESLHLVGTAPYMAPEQAACRPVRPASDWYAVGVMLYEALTGRRPFVGPLLEVLRRKQHEDPPDPRELVPEVPDDLAALCLELLRRDAEARPTGTEILRRLGAHPRTDSPMEVPLIGRQSHLQALESAFEAVRQGRTVVLALHGRSGVGKTALLRCFLDRLAERGVAVALSGRCYEQESVPYKALDNLIDALSRYLEGLPAAAAQALLPRDILALARVFPVLRRLEAVAQAPRRSGDVADPQELRRRARAALRELLARLGDHQPLVLAIDDLQWGDMDSAALLADLLRPPDPPVLLLLGSYRSEDVAVSPCLRAFRQLLQQGEAVEGRELAVEPLSPAEQRELARSLLSPDDPASEGHAERIARQSGGYPFFVHELVQHLQAGGPLAAGGEGPGEEATLPDVLWSRVQHLPEEARGLLEVVAVAGQPVAQEQAFRAAELQGDERQALALLRAARLLRGAGPGERHEVETYHDRIRETVAARQAPDVRRRHHRRLAEVREAAGGCDPEVLATHWQGAGDSTRAGHYYARAADQAAEALAFDRAAKLYRVALELQAPSPEQERPLRARLGDALAMGGRGKEAAREYLAASAGVMGAEALELQRRAALQLLSGGHIDDGLAAMRTVLAAAGLRLPSSPRRTFWSLVWLRLRLRLRGLGFRRRGEEEVPPAELAAVDACLTAAAGLSMVDNIQGACFQSQALLLALRAGEPRRLVLALVLAGAHESIGGTRSRPRTEKLLGVAEQLAREADERSQPFLLALVLLARGIAATLAGDWPAGQRLCDEATDHFRQARRDVRTGFRLDQGTAHTFALWSLGFMGEFGELARRLPVLIKEAQERGDLYGETNLILVNRALVGMAADEPEQARAELRQIMGRWTRQGFHLQHLIHLHDEAHLDVYQGEGLSAWKRLAEAWPLLKRSHLLRAQMARIIIHWIRARSALAATAQVADPEPFLRAAERDAKVLWREGAGWARALAQMVRAGAARARGDVRGALELLRDAADRCDATAMRGFASGACWRLVELLGGAKGKELLARTKVWLRAPTIDKSEVQNQVADLLAGAGSGPPTQKPTERDRLEALIVELLVKAEPWPRAQKPKDLDRLAALILPGFGPPRA